MYTVMQIQFVVYERVIANPCVFPRAFTALKKILGEISCRKFQYQLTSDQVNAKVINR